MAAGVVALVGDTSTATSMLGRLKAKFDTVLAYQADAEVEYRINPPVLPGC
jgi:hypothetical protein